MKNQKKALRYAACIWMLVMMVVWGSSDMVSYAASKVPQVKGVEAVSQSYESVTISWKQAQGVTGYQVYRSTSKNGTYKKVKTINKSGTIQYTDKKLKSGTTYFYKVCAYQKKGSKVSTGKFSKVVSVKPTPAAPVVNSVTSKDYKTVQIKWKKVAGASGYLIYRSSTKSGGYRQVAEAKASATSAKATNLISGTTYYFRVRAYRTEGGRQVLGPYSDAISGYSVPAAPEVNSVQLESKTSATLVWKFVSGSNGYYVYRSTSEGSGYSRIGTITKNSTKEFLDKKVVKGKTYYYKVAAYRTVNGKKVEGNLSKAIKLRAVTSYTVGASSKPYAGNYMKNPNYNSRTRQYFMLKSYLDLLERLGGGELRLKRGTYNLWKPLYIPSNTTIRFDDGVVMRNSVAEANNHGIFVLANATDMDNGKKYTKYNGAHDIKLIGTGTVIFDKEYRKHTALLIGHTQNILIDGITFKNMRGDSHFIELDASKNVEIKNCTFTGYKDVGIGKEAINLDVPDKKTEGFSGTFSSMDKTPNNGISIHDNKFKNLPSALGTHMYTYGSAHSNISIVNNQIENCGYDGIRVLNWKNSVVKNNKITKVRATTKNKEEGGALAIEMRGANNVEVSGNTVTNSDRFMVIKVACYDDNMYDPVYNKINKDKVIHNKTSNIKSGYDIYYSNKLDFSDHEYWEAVK